MNPLVNVLSPKARRIAYAVLFVAATVFSVVQGSKGDWVEVVGGVITALLGLTAASNASPTPTAPEPVLPEDGYRDGYYEVTDPVSGNQPETNDYGYRGPDPI